MTLEEILALQDFAAIKKELTVKEAPKVPKENCLKQYDPSRHDIFDETKRPKKLVKKASGQKDDKGQPIYVDAQEEVARIAIPFQDIIVERAVGFLLGNRIDIKPQGGKDNEQQKKLLAMIEKTWNKSKLDFLNTDIAKKLFSECEVAELWYLVEAEEGYWGDLSKGKFKPKMKILAESLGDKLYPYFDLTGDMVAFSREYDINANGKIENHFDVYTAEKTIKYRTIEGNTVSEIKPNLIKKIPVVYYQQQYPDWYKVQSMIERLETSVSNRADSNDYSGAPITVVKGILQGFASKGEQGKVLQVDGNGDVKYLESTNAPESVKLEWEALREFILSMTQTPDISFSQMKNLGQLSGIALKLMFLDAHMKARRNERVFGECIQRRLNLLMSIIGNVIETTLSETAINLDLVPVFTPYLPINEKEEIENLATAISAEIISKETAVNNNPLVSDPKAEIEKIKSDKSESIASSVI
jgi:SPP1 family phage portal protein